MFSTFPYLPCGAGLAMIAVSHARTVTIRYPGAAASYAIIPNHFHLFLRTGAITPYHSLFSHKFNVVYKGLKLIIQFLCPRPCLCPAKV